MEEMAEVCDRIYVIDKGRTAMGGTPAAVFGNGETLRAQGLDVPTITQLADALAASGLPIPSPITTLDEAVDAIAALLKQQRT